MEICLVESIYFTALELKTHPIRNKKEWNPSWQPLWQFHPCLPPLLLSRRNLSEIRSTLGLKNLERAGITKVFSCGTCLAAIEPHMR